MNLNIQDYKKPIDKKLILTLLLIAAFLIWQSYLRFSPIVKTIEYIGTIKHVTHEYDRPASTTRKTLLIVNLGNKTI